MSSLLLAQMFAFLTALGFATSDVAARFALRTSTPISGTLMMALMTLLMFGPFAMPVLFRESLDRLGLLVFFIAGITAPGFAAYFHYLSFRRIGMARTISIVGCTPLLTVVFAVLALDERPAPPTYLGTVSIVAGVMVLANEQRATARSRREGKSLRHYFIFAVGALFMFSAAATLRKVGIQLVPSLSLALSTAGAGTVIAVLGLYPFLPPAERIRMDRRTIWQFALSGGLGALGHLFFFAAVKHGPLSTVAPLVYTTPLFAVFFSWLFFRELETLNARVIAGAVLICTGAVLVAIARP